MGLADMFPKKTRNLYTRLKWFTRNYHQINFNSQIKPTDIPAPSVYSHYHGPITYDTDGLTTSNNADFIKEPRFKKAYDAALETHPWDGFTLQWRVYIICWFADMVKDLQGDFVECGVNTGAYARAIIEYINFDSLAKQYYLFDTFQGLADDLVSEEEIKAGIDYYMGSHYKDVYEQVLETFRPFNTKIIRGVVPSSLSEFSGDKVCFLSIDMNVMMPEIAAANYFWSRLVNGGVMVIDDYGFPMHINQKIAFDDFARNHQQEILSLPTGQGIIIKK
jgi:O-methyltransferase